MLVLAGSHIMTNEATTPGDHLQKTDRLKALINERMVMALLSNFLSLKWYFPPYYRNVWFQHELIQLQGRYGMLYPQLYNETRLQQEVMQLTRNNCLVNVEISYQTLSKCGQCFSVLIRVQQNVLNLQKNFFQQNSSVCRVYSFH